MSEKPVLRQMKDGWRFRVLGGKPVYVGPYPTPDGAYRAAVRHADDGFVPLSTETNILVIME